MNIRIGKSRLLEGLKKVQAAANGKTTLPICGNVKMTAKDGKLALTATDLDITLYSEVDCEVDEPGETTVTIRKLIPAVAAIAEGEVTMATDGENINFTCGNFRAKFSTLPAEDFPKLPDTDGGVSFTINGKAFAKLINEVCYAQSSDITRKTLNGVFVDVKGDTIKCVATDARRLSVAEAKIDGNESEASFIIPMKSVAIIQKAVETDGDVLFNTLGTQIFVSVGDGSHRVYSRLIDGEYPKYGNVIPKNSTADAVVDRNDLISAISRVSVITSDTQSVKITFSKGLLLIESTDSDNCTANDEIPIKYDGEEITMRMNPHYLQDPLRAASDDEIKISISGSFSPIVITSEGDGFFCVLMPLRIS